MKLFWEDYKWKYGGNLKEKNKIWVLNDEFKNKN